MDNNTNNINQPDYAKEAAIVAFMSGISGFLAGFIGPLILYPGSNQGPLFGIFLSGPISFVGGGVLFGYLPLLIKPFRKIEYRIIRITSVSISAIATILYLAATKGVQ